MLILSKKKKVLVTIAILSCIILSFIGGQSFSKYVTEVTGNGTAEVASWNFKVNGEGERVQTIHLASTYNNETLVDNKIAPGTGGQFDIIIDGTGTDVGIDYKIRFENETPKPENVVFIYQDQEFGSLAQLQTQLSGTIEATNEDKLVTLPIKWKWPYETGRDDMEIETNDRLDTQNAKDIRDYTFNVIVSGTQVVPQH